MEYKELNKVLADLDQAMIALEDKYMENEGEITEETESLEDQVSGLKELLTKEGVDLLGGWLKAKEDKKKSLKAEKDFITRQIASVDNTIDFIKFKLNQIMTATGQHVIKGDRGYTFGVTTKVKTQVDMNAINDKYLEMAQVGARMEGIPDWLDVQLKATATDIQEAGGDALDFITKESTPSVRFSKPRASKKEEE